MALFFVAQRRVLKDRQHLNYGETQQFSAVFDPKMKIRRKPENYFGRDFRELSIVLVITYGFKQFLQGYSCFRVPEALRQQSHWAFSALRAFIPAAIVRMNS